MSDRLKSQTKRVKHDRERDQHRNSKRSGSGGSSGGRMRAGSARGSSKHSSSNSNRPATAPGSSSRRGMVGGNIRQRARQQGLAPGGLRRPRPRPRTAPSSSDGGDRGHGQRRSKADHARNEYGEVEKLAGMGIFGRKAADQQGAPDQSDAGADQYARAWGESAGNTRHNGFNGYVAGPPGRSMRKSATRPRHKNMPARSCSLDRSGRWIQPQPVPTASSANENAPFGSSAGLGRGDRWATAASSMR